MEWSKIIKSYKKIKYSNKVQVSQICNKCSIWVNVIRYIPAKFKPENDLKYAKIRTNVLKLMKKLFSSTWNMYGSIGNKSSIVQECGNKISVIIYQEFNTPLICFIRTVWVQFDQIWLTVIRQHKQTTPHLSSGLDSNVSTLWSLQHVTSPFPKMSLL